MSRRSFFLLGQETLLVRCAQELLGRHHEIVGVVAPEGPVAHFARENGLPYFSEIPELEAGACDWLLSITWLDVVPEQQLRAPRLGAINFHDGPLPEHAGLLAPTWAILQGDHRHSVCWHRMEPRVDSGEVHVERSFAIDESDTTFTLNAKCFEQGFEAFLALLPGLESGSLPSRAQREGLRQQHMRWDRPPSAGQIDWRRSADDCTRLFRALDFGPTANSLGRAWLRVGDHVVQPLHLEVCTDVEEGAPGCVLRVDEDALVVGCREGAVRLVGFESPEGELLAGTARCPHRLLRPGDVLASPEAAARLEEVTRESAKHEAFWVDRLAALEPLTTPWLRDDAHPAREWRFSGSHEAETWIAALTASLGRLSARREFHCGVAAPLPDCGPDLFARVLPVAVHWGAEQSCGQFLETIELELATIRKRGTYLRNLFTRHSQLLPLGRGGGCVLPIRISFGDAEGAAHLHLVLCGDGAATLHCAEGVASEREFQSLVELIDRYLGALRDSPERPLLDVPLIGTDQLGEMRARARTSFSPLEDPPDLATQFRAAVRSHPDRVAIRSQGRELSYQELDREVETLARAIRALGISQGDLVAVHLPRSLEMVVASHAIQRAGAAYVPLDPEYPRERLIHVLQDSGCRLLLTTSGKRQELASFEDLPFLELDRDRGRIVELANGASVAPPPAPDDLAYVIYTSGSTGMPKGVEIEHRSVLNFFAGMDECVGVPGPDENKVWLAVTSLSFDISVLELFWTLCRGFTVVLHGGSEIGAASSPMRMSLAYFASDSGENPDDRYRLLREGALFADANGFEAVWTPERHFHAFGGLYPNPAVTSAALATWTERVHLRAGSVVTGLHHPIRVAEEWSVIDNLSRGRAGIGLASGWHPNDFVLAPDRYEGRKERMVEDLHTIRRLWRGEEVVFENPIQEEFSVRIQPEPLSPELPVWITAAGNPETFRIAGEQGCNLLTHLLGQNVEELANKIRMYREAYATSEHARERGVAGQVTLLLHTYVTGDDEEALREARDPMQRYLGTAADLIKKHVSSWSAVRTSLEPGQDDEDLDLEKLPAEDLQALLDHAFERYAQGSALFGSPESCASLIERLRQIGVDEIACLIDFGVPTQKALDALPHLNRLRQQLLFSAPQPTDRESIEELTEEHGVTHLQCTPSMATMLVSDETTWPALSRLECMLVGGEAVSPKLARDLVSRLKGGRLLDVYGPTETTVWSSAAVLDGNLDIVPIGSPIRNTSFWILDPVAVEAGRLSPMPDGVVGELWIGGDGLARGYRGLPELTEASFRPDQLSESGPEPSARLYRTGDLARFLPDGQYGHAGRIDHQVKIRGFRIELGEVEAVLSDYEAVGLAAVVVEQKDESDVRLTAFVSPKAHESPHVDHLREHVRRRLPAYMVPNEFIVLPDLPRTPNGKIDRRRLVSDRVEWHTAPPRLQEGAKVDPGVGAKARAPRVASEAPSSPEEIREMLRRLWEELLGKELTDLEANFFDLGGHSLMTIKVQSRLAKEFGRRIPLVDLFRFPTIRGLTEHLLSFSEVGAKPADAGAEDTSSRGARRAAKRRELRRNKR